MQKHTKYYAIQVLIAVSHLFCILALFGFLISGQFYFWVLLLLIVFYTLMLAFYHLFFFRSKESAETSMKTVQLLKKERLYHALSFFNEKIGIAVFVVLMVGIAFKFLFQKPC